MKREVKNEKKWGIEDDRNLRCCEDYELNEESRERSGVVKKSQSEEEEEEVGGDVLQLVSPIQRNGVGNFG